MLSPADADLAARDPALRGLAVLLDDDALSAWLGAPARRRYLRYKPGTSCVLAAAVAGQRVLVTAYADHSAAKLAKSLDRAPAGTVLARDAGRLLVAALPAADRDLPAVARLAHPLSRAALLGQLLPGLELADAELRTLVYKPQRRWVGLLTPADGDPVVLRVFRPGDAAAALAATKELSAGPPRTPRVLASLPRRGVVAVQWLPGRPLDTALADGTAGLGDLAGAGAVLAALHARRLTRLRPHTVEDDAAAVERTVAQIALLQPDLAQRAADLRDALVPQLRNAPGIPGPAHGDFSADQVILGADGQVGLVDLDSAVSGEPALDLGGAAAALHAAAVLGGDDVAVVTRVDALHAGYSRGHELPLVGRLTVHTAAALLRRTGDPFRLCASQWPARMERMLSLAESTGRVPA